MFNAIILAAGEGKRMKSAKSKVLHDVSFQPLVKWVIDATADAEKQIVADVLKYLHGQLVNEIDNHAGLENPETVRLADAIKQSDLPLQRRRNV